MQKWDNEFCLNSKYSGFIPPKLVGFSSYPKLLRIYSSERFGILRILNYSRLVPPKSVGGFSHSESLCIYSAEISWDFSYPELPDFFLRNQLEVSSSELLRINSSEIRMDFVILNYSRFIPPIYLTLNYPGFILPKSAGICTISNWFPSIYTNFHRYPMSYTNFHRIPPTFIKFHLISPISTDLR